MTMSRIYHLYKAIAILTQHVSPVVVYFSKLKGSIGWIDLITPHFLVVIVNMEGLYWWFVEVTTCTISHGAQ